MRGTLPEPLSSGAGSADRRRKVPEACQRGLPTRMHAFGATQEVGVVALPGVALGMAHQQVPGSMGPVHGATDAQHVLDQGTVDMRPRVFPAEDDR